MIGVFLQVRLDSVRLPRKALLPLGGIPLIQQAMFRLADIPADVYAMLTTDDSLKELGPLVVWPFKVFVGPKDDVLKRYAQAVEYYGVDTVVRATGDNPLFDAGLCKWLIDEHFDRGADLSCAEGAAVGSCGDIISAWAILAADRFAETKHDREHVTPFMHRNCDSFKIHKPLAPRRWQSDAYLTVDTPEDYESVKRFF